VATGRIEMQPATLALIEAGNAKKGDVLGIARIAGIRLPRRPATSFPCATPGTDPRGAGLCPRQRPSPRRHRHCCTATVETVGPTGVEMEALTAVQVALLTIYDMCKAADRGMSIHDVRVLQKHGGKSGSYVAD
jgi:cyclic pyranopterin phosphate synthase